jgi:murein DD-endopeptidase MepM/ murein hydrolase activator NlpD
VRPRSIRLVAVAVAVATVLVGGGGRVAAASCWSPPVSAPVSDPFRRPMCRWCPGNRGVEYATPPGAVVRAVATGRVTFSGRVVGVGYVVVAHPDGLRVTYGGLDETRPAVGQVVRRGAAVGTTSGPLHLGVRSGAEYLDPEPFVGRWAGRIRLVPLDPSAVRPPAPGRLVCPMGSGPGAIGERAR